MMKGGSRKMIRVSICSLLKTKAVKKRTIIVGLKSDNHSREMLLRLLNSVVVAGDSVLVVHVHGDSSDCFDPNTFHFHEDLCKSKQVDFQVKVCTGSSYVSELSHQVRIHYATVLAVGCSSPSPKDSTVNKYLMELPPSCSLLVVDYCGKILTQKQGTSQQGGSLSSSAEFSGCYLQKSQTLPPEQAGAQKMLNVRKSKSFPRVTPKLFDRLATLEVKGYSTRFSHEELKYATNDFSPEMLIGEGGNSKVYRSIFRDGQSAAVKVLNMSRNSEEDLFREVEILSRLDHANVVQLLGYCYYKDLQAVVYVLLKESLRQMLKQLSWNQRMQIAVGIAKALEYLHSLCPPIVHRDVKSSNILLSENTEPQLSDFGAAMVLHENQQASEVIAKPIHVVGTFGYLAPEYMMYGRVDEKVDVYSYGVVLLELITGREAILAKKTSSSGQESLVLWARSLLTTSLCERLIDPNLEENFKKDEMKVMMMAARLCLLHSPSRRPSMKTILRLFEEPEKWLEMQRKKETTCKCEMEISRNEESLLSENLPVED